MIEIGKVQKLEVVRMSAVGAYLNSSDGPIQEAALLPRKELPEGVDFGDELEVYVYTDDRDRLMATFNAPTLSVGDIAYLQVIKLIESGAFLDWGMEKDLFLPKSFQRQTIQKGKSYWVALITDDRDRLVATMDIYDSLSDDSPYKVGDEIKGVAYDIKEEMGIFVAVDNKYHGLVPRREMFGNVKPGDEVTGRVTSVREDGKLDLSLRKVAHLEIDSDSEAILNKLKAYGGVLEMNDQSPPEDIKKEFRMSKRAFKRAVGSLLKEKKIEFIEGGIKLKES